MQGGPNSGDILLRGVFSNDDQGRAEDLCRSVARRAPLESFHPQRNGMVNVRFGDAEDAEDAVRQLDGAVLERSRRMTVEWADVLGTKMDYFYPYVPCSLRKVRLDVTFSSLLSGSAHGAPCSGSFLRLFRTRKSKRMMKPCLASQMNGKRLSSAC